MIQNTPADRVDEAIVLLKDVVHLYRTTLACSVGAVDLPFGQLRALSHVFHRRRCTVSEVAAGIGVSLATASELLDRLVDAGFLERSVNPLDRRQVVVSLTPHAVAVGERAHELRRRQITAAFAEMEEGEQRGFIVGLQAVIGSLNDALKPGSSRETMGLGSSEVLEKRERAAIDAGVSSAID